MKWHLSAANFVRGIFICLLGFWSKYFLEQGIFVDVMMIGKVSFFFFGFLVFVIVVCLYFSREVSLLIVESQEPR